MGWRKRGLLESGVKNSQAIWAGLAKDIYEEVCAFET